MNTPTQSSYYYADQNNQPVGPCSFEELEKLAQEGRITTSTLVCKAGENRWESFKAVREAHLEKKEDSQEGQSESGSKPDKPVEKPGGTGGQQRSAFMEALDKAWLIFKKLARDPVGQLPAVAGELGQTQGKTVGLVFGGAFIASSLLSMYFQPVMREFLKSNLLNAILASAVPFVSVLAGISLTRAMFKGSGALGSDILIAGTALLPLAITTLVGPWLAANKLEILAGLLLLFSVTTWFLLLHAGCVAINRLSTRSATLALPLILLGAGILSALLLVPILRNAKLPLGSFF